MLGALQTSHSLILSDITMFNAEARENYVVPSNLYLEEAAQPGFKHTPDSTSFPTFLLNSMELFCSN